MMGKISNSKNQITNKHQVPSAKLQTGLVFDAWSLGFIWKLGFGVWDF